jgi:hypothetical protein
VQQWNRSSEAEPLNMVGCSGAWKPSTLRVPDAAVVSYTISVMPLAEQELFKIKKKDVLMGNQASASSSLSNPYPNSAQSRVYTKYASG